MANGTPTKDTTTKNAYKGVCNSCHQEFDKSKMTQHLKSCKERKASIEAEAARASQSVNPRTTKLYQVLVEGKYQPEYWMHIELPALFTLYDLDTFLRDTWVECCDHLSEFRIGKKSFLSRTEEDIMSFGDFLEAGEEDGDDEEEEDLVATQEDDLNEEQSNDDDDEDNEEYYGEDVAEAEAHIPIGPSMAEIMRMSPREMLDNLSNMLTRELQSDVTSMPLEEFQDRFLQFFQQRLQVESPEDAEELAETPEFQDQLKKMAGALHMMFQFPILANMVMPEERDMGFDVRDVLKVGDKFDYEYDFGSTTYLRLKVMNEREGYYRKDEDAARILARNLPPEIFCRECGKLATRVEPGYMSAWDGALCDTCARKIEDYEYEELLPVVNSPRVGVCGYVGDFYAGA